MMPDQDKEKGRKEFQEATGIDIEKDIQSIVACLVMEGEDKYPVVVIRGNFDEGRIEALAREHGGTVDTSSGHADHLAAQGRSCMTTRPKPTRPATDEGGKRRRRRLRGNFHPAMAFVEPGLLLFGREEAVRAGASRKAGHGNGQNLTVECRS